MRAKPENQPCQSAGEEAKSGRKFLPLADTGGSTQAEGECAVWPVCVHV